MRKAVSIAAIVLVGVIALVGAIWLTPSTEPSPEHKGHNYYENYAATMDEKIDQSPSLYKVDSPLEAIGPGARTVQVGCNVFQTATIDPIVDPPAGQAHRHHFIGKRPVTADSTLQTLLQGTGTSCATPSALAAYWFPCIRDTGDNPPRCIPIRYTNVYYNGDGSQEAWPQGAEIIAMPPNADIDARCGGSNAREIESAAQLEGCSPQDQFRIRIQFPNCWNGQGLTPENFVYNPRECPSTHPREMHQTRFAIHYNANYAGSGTRINNLEVNMGADQWETDLDRYFHADEIASWRLPNQNLSFYNLLDRCGTTQQQSGPMPSACRTGNPE